MNEQLLNKFTGRYLWAILWLSTVTYAVASVHPVADTCQHPDPPVITGSAKAICRHAPVTLAAAGCSGTVIWSNGDTGSLITVNPQQTTKYTAVCRAKQGCISCFAEVWKVTVNTPEAPVLTPSSTLICPNESITLTASNCAGTVHWPDQTTGLTWTGTLHETTTFQATCEQNSCFSNPSTAVVIQVALPAKPAVYADKRDVCTGQSVQLTASGCAGIIFWSDGEKGAVRSVMPYKTTNYRAMCQIGSCQSDSSRQLLVSVRETGPKPEVSAVITNSCPFQTADLSKAIASTNAGSAYAFRTEPLLTSAAVQSPVAVTAGTYYLFGRTTDGCYTEPATVSVTITSCQNAIPPCLSNPAVVAIQLDSINSAKGIVYLTAQLGGFSTAFSWQNDGNGLFTNKSLQARYLLSETDRQRGVTTFSLSVPDPDGSGPCVGALAQQTLTVPSRELVGLSKEVSEPNWVVEGSRHLVEITYLFTAVNMGTHNLAKVDLSDDLDAVFSGTGALIQAVTFRADSSLNINPAYTGRGMDTTLISGGYLPVNSQARVWLTVRLDVSQSSTLTFRNKAHIQAEDINGALCRDQSTKGLSADPDQNGNPGDNSEWTSITLHSVQPEEGEIVFIPEGFSPNGDGVNDLFVIQRVPEGVLVELEIYNRWGQLVYQQKDYKNDWNGTANQSSRSANARQDLPDGTYYYQVRLSDGREFVRFLTLIR